MIPAHASVTTSAQRMCFVLVAASGLLCLPQSASQTTFPVTPNPCPVPAVWKIGSTAFTVPCYLGVYYPLSTAPNPGAPLSPPWMGVNSGHNNDSRCRS